MLGRLAVSKIIDVRPVGGLENTSNTGGNPNINNLVWQCLFNCLSATREGFFSLFENCPHREGNCAAIERQKLLSASFASCHVDASPGPPGTSSESFYPPSFVIT